MKINEGAYRNRTDVHGFAEACSPITLLYLLMKIKVRNRASCLEELPSVSLDCDSHRF